ncbi:MAG: ferritin-like domain-containing protein [Gammaproteobacteria bacterium]|nr:ferritin-like domain-containing protein [Gammaproteobacteria bacterium]
MTSESIYVFSAALNCLLLSDPQEKIKAVRELNNRWLATSDSVRLPDESVSDALRIAVPGRPGLPRLVNPREVPRRGFNSESARLKLVHAITHIEFNAINLALDAVYRFRGLPRQFYTDWLNIAVEEVLHFSLLEDYLKSRGSYYGAYDSHNGLWEMAVKTDHDVLVRMALVPRVLEARGLDVTPGMISKFEHIGETDVVDILNIIQRDEIGHVERGNYWFKELCRQRSLDPRLTFHKLLDEYMEESIFDSLNQEIRIRAGFSKQELIDLASRNRHTR